MDIVKLKSLIEEVCEISVGDIDETTKLKDLGLDSLDLAQVIFSIENELDINIDSESLEHIVTVKDALKAIEKAVKSDQ